MKLVASWLMIFNFFLVAPFFIRCASCLPLKTNLKSRTVSQVKFENSHYPRLMVNAEFSLTLLWRRSLSYRNQSIDLLCKLMDWFLYYRDLCYEKVNLFRAQRQLRCRGPWAMEEYRVKVCDFKIFKKLFHTELNLIT